MFLNFRGMEIKYFFIEIKKITYFTGTNNFIFYRNKYILETKN